MWGGLSFCTAWLTLTSGFESILFKSYVALLITHMNTNLDRNTDMFLVVHPSFPLSYISLAWSLFPFGISMLQQSTRSREALAARRYCLSDCISTPSTFNHIIQCHVQLDRNINYTDACMVALIDQVINLPLEQVFHFFASPILQLLIFSGQ